VVHDVVIVGAGSAGCVLAERLSRHPDRSVLLLERGPGWPGTEVTDLYHLPVGADAARLGRTVGYPVRPDGSTVVRGNGIGGSAAVNGAYFLRWHRDDFRSWEHTLADIDAAYRDVESAMSVSAFRDDELTDTTHAFEQWFGPVAGGRSSVDAGRGPAGREGIDSRWPRVGVNRVRSNSIRDACGGRRVTSAEAILRPALDRSNLTVRIGAEVTALERSGDRVTGVRCGAEVIGCGEVVLCAGTLGTASLLFGSGFAAGSLRIDEHREILVHYQPTTPAECPVPLLPSVAHTESGVEIRCYGGDFADYIDGVPRVGPAMGVAAMSPATSGELRWDGIGLTVDLGAAPDLPARLGPELDQVRDMLHSAAFRGLVVPSSVRVDPVVRTSQHAFGSLPMGERTDRFGVVEGARGLRVVDGSILPVGGRSGPHATITMLAGLIGASAR
jgi:choline dehydrogenase